MAAVLHVVLAATHLEDADLVMPPVGDHRRLHDRAEAEAAASKAADYIAAAELTAADIISARIILDGRLQIVKPGHGELHGLESYISSHSVGAIFRRELHDHLGYYSRKLPICADQLFVIQAYRAGARIHRAEVPGGWKGRGLKWCVKTWRLKRARSLQAGQRVRDPGLDLSCMWALLFFV